MTPFDETGTVRQFRELTESMFMGLNLSKFATDETGTTQTPVIHVKDLNNGVLADRDKLGNFRIPKNKLGRQELRHGDVLVSARGTLLKCAVVGPTHVGSVASANFIIVRTGKSPLVKPELLCAFLRQAETQALLLSRVSNTAQPALTISDLESLSLAVPPLDKQQALVRLVRAADELFQIAVTLAELRRDEALSILADHMHIANAQE
ncbi:restriction endonuclease S subunit [Ensifer sp. KUDG1]|uniref:restriction endonuclease subunit S n=1 Tax=unclassified Ensifer TaxID=2633371 RepID=UPI003D1AAB5F